MIEDLQIGKLCDLERRLSIFKQPIEKIHIQFKDGGFTFNPYITEELGIVKNISDCLLKYYQNEYKKAVYSMKEKLASYKEDGCLEQ